MVPMLDVLSSQVLLGIALGTIPALMVGLLVYRLGLANPGPGPRTPSGVVGSFIVTWVSFAAWMGGLAGNAPDLMTFPWAAWGAGVCTFVGLAGSARADAAAMEVLKLIEGRVTSSRAASMNAEDFARLTRAVRGGIGALTALALVALWIDVLPIGEASSAVVHKLFLLAVNLAAGALMVSLVLVAMDALESPEVDDARKIAVPIALLLAAVTLIGGIGIAAGLLLLAVFWWERARIVPWLHELWAGVRLHARFDGLKARTLLVDGQVIVVQRIGPLTTVVRHGDNERTWRNTELWEQVLAATE